MTRRFSRPARKPKKALYWSTAGRRGHDGTSPASRSNSASGSSLSVGNVIWQIRGTPVCGSNRPFPYG
jgi:hypothetical protein